MSDKQLNDIESKIREILLPYCDEKVIQEVIYLAFTLYDTGYDDGASITEPTLSDEKYNEGYKEGYDDGFKDGYGTRPTIPIYY